MDDDPVILTFRSPLLRAKRRPKMPAGRSTVAFSAPTPSDPSILADDRPTAVLDARKSVRPSKPRKRPETIRMPAPRKTEFPIELAALQRQLNDDLADLVELEASCYATNLTLNAAGPTERRAAQAHLNRLGQRVMVLESRIDRTRAEIDRCY